MKAQCIAAVTRAIGRELSKAEADGIESRIRDNLRGLAREDLNHFAGLSVGSRLEEAAKRAAEQIKGEAATAKRQTQMAVAAHARTDIALAAMRDRGLDAQDALDRMLLETADGKSSGMALETRIKATQEDYKRRLTHVMEAVEPRMLGLMADPAASATLTRELFGEHTGVAIAAKAAEEWRKTVDAMVAQFRDAGGVMHRLEDWRFPQTHDQVRVFNTGADTWTADVFGKLDRSRYVSENGRLMTDEEVRGLLVNAWDTIATGGANKIEPGIAGARTATANRFLEHRVLHFKDAASYLDYQSKYGGRDLWSIMSGHVDRLARSIALVEHFGPNPDHEFAYWNDWSAREARLAKKNALAVATKLDNAYRYLAGYTEGVTNTFVARAFDDTRNILAAARLGSAVLSSIPDLATLTMTARYNHVSVLGTWGNSLKAMLGSSEGRRELERAGLMVNSAMNSLRRYQVDSLGASFSSRLANAVLTASGLNHWTDSLRAGFAATHAHALGFLTRAHDWASVPPEDRALLEHRGVTDVDWQVWRLAQMERTRFGELLTPDAIYRIPDEALAAVRLPDVADVARTPDQLRREAAQKLLGVTLSEGNMAVIEPGARERLQMATQLPRGSMKGELIRSFYQFKTFPWAFVEKQIVQRGLRGQDTVGGKIGYVGPLVILSTLLGAAAMQIKDMISGKDPRPLMGADGKVLVRNWIAAFLQGGALGVYGDFLGADATGDAKSALATLLGPVAGMVSDAGSLALGNAVKAGSNQITHVGADAVKFVKGVTPGANLWYAKAAFDHWLFGYLQDRLNPGYLARMQARARQQFGSNYWWAPRDAGPSRAPDLSAIEGRR